MAEIKVTIKLNEEYKDELVGLQAELGDILKKIKALYDALGKNLEVSAEGLESDEDNPTP